jgi:5,6-dimethylbenzimidazole synthase
MEHLFDLAGLAPSVGLSQPWRFVLVNSLERRAAIKANFERCNVEALAAQPAERVSQYARLKLAGLDEAPCHVAVLADRSTAQGPGLGRRTIPEMIGYSAVMAVYTLWLLARAEGVGLGWVSILDPKQVISALDGPEAWTFIGYLCLGYPDRRQHSNSGASRLGAENSSKGVPHRALDQRCEALPLSYGRGPGTPAGTPSWIRAICHLASEGGVHHAAPAARAHAALRRSHGHGAETHCQTAGLVMSTVKWPSCSTENRFFLMTNLAEAPRKFPD